MKLIIVPSPLRHSRSALVSCLVFGAGVALASCNARDGVDRRANGDGTESFIEANNSRIRPKIVRGDNGVEVLSFTADAFERAPRLSLDTVPLAVAGGSAGSRDYDLTYVSEVRLLSDNRLVAFANIGARVMVFGADGKEERTIGRLGKGPGEFTRPGGVVVLPGDTLFLTDVPNNRLNWVMPDGRFVRTPAMAWEKMVRGPERLTGVLADGQIVLTSAGIVSWTESDTVYRSTASVVVQPLVGASREIAKIPDLATITVPVRLRGKNQRENMILRFTPRAHIAVWDSLIATSAGDAYRIALRSPSGAVLRELTIPLAKRPVTTAMKDEALRAELVGIEGFVGEGGSDVLSKDELREMARLTPFADSVPPIHRMLISTIGTLWVLDMSAASGATGAVATAFDKDGAIIGRLPLPEGASPVAFGADRVVLRALDDDDVVSLRVHRIVPAPRATPN